jgi:hypothetical protein
VCSSDLGEGFVHVTNMNHGTPAITGEKFELH